MSFCPAPTISPKLNLDSISHKTYYKKHESLILSCPIFVYFLWNDTCGTYEPSIRPISNIMVFKTKITFIGFMDSCFWSLKVTGTVQSVFICFEVFKSKKLSSIFLRKFSLVNDRRSTIVEKFKLQFSAKLYGHEIGIKGQFDWTII